MSHCFAGLPSPKPPNLVGKANTSLSVSLGASLPVMEGDKNSSYDVLQRLKEAAHVWHNTGEMGPLAVESVSEGYIGSMRLSDGNL